MGTEQINKRPKKNLADRLCPRVTRVGGLYRGSLYSFPHETLGAHRIVDSFGGLYRRLVNPLQLSDQ